MTKETKTLSQQICKLCGLEARSRGCTNEDISNTADCQGDCLDCTWYDPDEYYPDFENPENFVKLLELKTDDLNPRIGTLIRNACFIGTDFTRTECLKILIRILCFPENQDKPLLDEIKQSIRDYDDWVWG